MNISILTHPSIFKLMEKKEYECLNIGCNVSNNRSSKKRHREACTFPKPDDALLSLKLSVTIDGKDMFKCSSCPRTFNTDSNFSMHKKKCQENVTNENRKDPVIRKNNIFKCKHCPCPSEWTKKSLLLRHEKTHEKPILMCHACGKTYIRQDMLDNHIKKCCPDMTRENVIPPVLPSQPVSPVAQMEMDEETS